MPAQKRTRNGAPKPPTSTPAQPQQPQDLSAIDTPPCGQGQAQPAPAKAAKAATATPNQKPDSKARPLRTKSTSNTAKPPTNKPTNNPNKRAPLPPYTTITKRPLLHPSIPTPFSSSLSQKVLYITATTPFIPAVKRIRSLLTQIASRDAQSSASISQNRGKGRGRSSARVVQATGRLAPRDVEASIADTAAAGGARGNGKGSVGGEMVYLKATGRAIPRALELGVKFQGEEDCFVRVEMGSVKTVDDVEVRGAEEGDGEDGEEEEEVPETRIRTLSSVTVCIGLR